MLTHSYCNLRYGVLHSSDWVTSTGHRIHNYFSTVFYDDICWC
jgi:hypothetical protein